MTKITYEKVGDINVLYPYLYAYLGDSSHAFLEISVTDQQACRLIIQPCISAIELNTEHWVEILEKARSFMRSVIADEESWLRMTQDGD
jgi:hypothetical protein